VVGRPDRGAWGGWWSDTAHSVFREGWGGSAGSRPQVGPPRSVSGGTSGPSSRMEAFVRGGGFLGAPVDHRRAWRLLCGGGGVGPAARRAAARHAPDPSTSRPRFRHERPASPPASPLPSVALFLHDLLASSVAPVTALGLRSTTRAPSPLLHVPPTCTLIFISTAPRLAPHGRDNHHPLRPLTATLAATGVRAWPPPSTSPRCSRHKLFGAFARAHGAPRGRAVPDCRATV